MVTLADTVSIAITAVNDAPVAVADAFTISAATLVVSAPGVLANDADLDGPSLSAELVQPPGAGSVQLQPNGGFTYTPGASYQGTDSFTYRATDGTLPSAAVTVSISGSATVCLPRPRVVPRPVAGGGKLNVHVEATPLNTQQNNPLQRLVFDRLDNAKVTVNGQPMTHGQTYTAPANTHAVDFTVERVTPGQPTTVHLTVVDGCGEWKTFVGGGTGAGF